MNLGDDVGSDEPSLKEVDVEEDVVDVTPPTPPTIAARAVKVVLNKCRRIEVEATSASLQFISSVVHAQIASSNDNDASDGAVGGDDDMGDDSGADEIVEDTIVEDMMN